jgi:stearoyl-CoA desaturase (delta-9 desaturase)
MTATTSDEKLRLSWPTILFILGTTLGALLWPVYAYFYGVTAGEIALALVYFVVAAMSITVGYHRLIAHRSFACRPWVKAAFLVVGSAAWQGSAMEWASDHVRHHGHTDTHKDPYNIKQGVWHAHIGWLFWQRDIGDVPGFLSEDRLIMLQHRYYVPLAIFTSFVVPYLIAGTGGLLLAGVVRIVAGHHITWLVNSWAHIGGNRPYNPHVSAADNWMVALFTFGEGWHNYHHTFPNDYRNGIGPWAWDPSKWLVWTMSKLGVAWDLKSVAPTVRWKKRVAGLMEYAEQDPDSLKRLRETKADLERQLEQSRVRLQSLLSDSLDFEQAAHESFRESRERVSQYLTERQEALTQRSRQKLERACDVLDNLDVYQSLLDSVASLEAKLAPTASA